VTDSEVVEFIEECIEAAEQASEEGDQKVWVFLDEASSPPATEPAIGS